MNASLLSANYKSNLDFFFTHQQTHIPLCSCSDPESAMEENTFKGPLKWPKKKIPAFILYLHLLIFAKFILKKLLCGYFTSISFIVYLIIYKWTYLHLPFCPSYRVSNLRLIWSYYLKTTWTFNNDHIILGLWLKNEVKFHFIQVSQLKSASVSSIRFLNSDMTWQIIPVGNFLSTLKRGQSETSLCLPALCQPPAVSALWEESGSTGRQWAVASLNTSKFKERGRGQGRNRWERDTRGERGVNHLWLGVCPWMTPPDSTLPIQSFSNHMGRLWLAPYWLKQELSHSVPAWNWLY